MDTAFPNRRNTLPGTPPPWLCKQTQKKSHPACSLLTGIVVAACQLVPTSLNQFIFPTSSLGHRLVPLLGSPRKEAGQVQAEAAPLSVQSPQGNFKGSTLWELLGTLQNRNGFRASRKISCLTFTPAACSSQNMRCTYSRKLMLTCEITF